MAFHVGQRVVCVNGDFSDYKYAPPNLPRTNGIYTLRDPFSADGWTWWRLVEIANHPMDVGYGILEPGFTPGRFRPIVERKTSIEIFTAMLTPKKQEIDA